MYEAHMCVIVYEFFGMIVLNNSIYLEIYKGKLFKYKFPLLLPDKFI